MPMAGGYRRRCFDYKLCRRLPEFMPVVMWGGASIDQLLNRLHAWPALAGHLDYPAWEAGKPLEYSERYDGTRQNLNE